MLGEQKNDLMTFEETQDGYLACPESKLLQPQNYVWDWKFHIAVLPTEENLAKARKALEAFFATDPLNKNKEKHYPRIKIISSKVDPAIWNPTLSASISEPVTDRDQRGKEICVYMSTHGNKDEFLLSPEEYKA